MKGDAVEVNGATMGVVNAESNGAVRDKARRENWRIAVALAAAARSGVG
jgi:hypothetical protein